ncbi:MAG: hypothetical protein QW666_00355 [Candidatus Woesearchaeota archaeon]
MNELDELKQEYATGKLEHIKKDLETFIKKNDLEIIRFCSKSNIPLDIGLRWYIILSKTINIANENMDQLEEMKKEVWYRREEGSRRKTEEIMIDWIKKHSGGWRSHRMLQVVYVYHMEKERYLKFLENP